MDEVRGGSRTLANQYSCLLEAKVGGHALWRPQDSRQHGGELGDCGYILDGHFWKLFNVYLDPPDGLQPLARPAIRDVKATRVPNSSIFQSSRSSTVAFEGSLPLTVPPITARFAGSVSLTDSSFAFLACSGIYRQEDVLSRVESCRLQRYLCENYSTLQRCGEGDVFIVRSTTKASGWIGGLATRGENDVSMTASFGIPGVGDFSLGIERHVASGEVASGTAAFVNCDKTTGPLEWTVDTPPVHPVILGVIRLRKRDRFRRALGFDSVVLGKPRDVHNKSATADFEQALETNELGVETASRPATNEVYRMQTNVGTASSTTSLSSISSDGMAGPSSALDHILDHFLECNSGFDAVVGDSALLSSFVDVRASRYQCEPRVGNVEFSWESEEGQDCVAFLTGLNSLESHSRLSTTAAPEPRRFSSDRPRSAADAMRGTSSSYDTPFTHQQPGFEPEYQFHADLHQFQSQESQWLPRHAQQPAHIGTPPDAPPGIEKDMRKSRKRQRAQVDLSSDDSDNHGKAIRLSGACRHCKKLKMRCEFPDGESTCRRCKAGGHRCIVEDRKPCTTRNKDESLLAQIRQKDKTISFLLQNIQSIQGAPEDDTSPSSPLAFNASIKEPPSTDGNENPDVVQCWLAHTGRYPSPGLDGEPGIDLNVAGTDQPMQSLPPEPAPHGMLANLVVPDNRGSGSSSVGDPEENSNGEIGVAPTGYFLKPAMDAWLIPGVDPASPEIIARGLVTFEEVDELFAIFFDRLNVVLPILDPVIHTPASTLSHCPCLFTVVCATAARYYAKKPKLYAVAMDFAKKAATVSLVQGSRNAEICQAFIILATYSAHAKESEEDRSRLYIEIAISISTELKLHLPIPTPLRNELRERQRLNRMRVWLICFNLNRSTSTQFGNMSTLREASIAWASPDWYKSSPYCNKYDVHLCAHTQLLGLMSRFIDEVFPDGRNSTGMNKNIDWMEVTNRHDDALSEWMSDQHRRFAESSLSDDPGCGYRTYFLTCLRGYARLVMHFFGFQSAVNRGIAKGDLFFQRCLEAAKTICVIMLDNLAPSGYLRYAPDSHFVLISFATAFLLKMLSQEYAHLVDSSERDRIVAVVSSVIDMLGSRDVSIDEKHTPKLYSRFLSSLLARQHQAAKEAPGCGPTPKAIQQSSASQPNMLQPQSSEAPPQQQQILPSSIAHLQVESCEMSDTGSDTVVERPPEELRADEMLANMHVLNNPSFWDNVMMPGYSWQQQPIFAPSYGTKPSQE